MRHDLGEGTERFALSDGWRVRLQADFGDNQGLGEDGGEGFGEGAEDFILKKVSGRIDQQFAFLFFSYFFSSSLTKRFPWP